MSCTIIGAGAVGLTLGAQLRRAGERVRFVTRREDAATALRTDGLAALDLAEDQERLHAVEAQTAAAGLVLTEHTPLFVCVRTHDLPAVADALAEHAPRARPACFVNDVGGEDALLGGSAAVAGGVWRQTCTRGDDRHVRFFGRGRVVLGLHPDAASGDESWLQDRATLLASAGLDVGISARIAEDKWLKLCSNLSSVPNALVRKEDHGSEAFVAIKVALLEEAREALAAAGIVAASCDGRDRSLEQEIAHQRGALARGDRGRALPLYNQVWASLTRGTRPEADAYHARILSLAERHGLAAPQNERIREAVLRAHAEKTGPESANAASLLA